MLTGGAVYGGRAVGDIGQHGHRRAGDAGWRHDRRHGADRGGTLQGYGMVNAATLQNDGVILAQNGRWRSRQHVGNALAVEVGPSAALDLSGTFSGGAITFTGGDGLVTLDDPAIFRRPCRIFPPPMPLTWWAWRRAWCAIRAEAIGTLEYSGQPGQYDLGLWNRRSPPASLPSPSSRTALAGPSSRWATNCRVSRAAPGCSPRTAIAPSRHSNPAIRLITANGDTPPGALDRLAHAGSRAAAARRARPVLILPRTPSARACPPDAAALTATLHLCGRRADPGHPSGERRDHPARRGQRCGDLLSCRARPARHPVSPRGCLANPISIPATAPGCTMRPGGVRPARRPFAPSVTTGARLATVRRRLHDIALAAGFSLTYWPVLRAVAAGQTALPEIRRKGRRRMAAFNFAEPVRDITLLSGTASPGGYRPGFRRPARAWRVHRETERVRLGEGFYPRSPGDDGAWMGRTGLPCGWSDPRRP